ncbi:MAG: hypothetical protein HUU54_16505 [Ignavibacteriaceae bacterium]|nr:hypothetical protein [Ignavibacteriaceae bacterium]
MKITILLVFLTLTILVLVGCKSKQKEFVSEVKNEFRAQETSTLKIITEEDLINLPEAVRKYIKNCGAVGKPRPYNMYIEFETELLQNPGAEPFRSVSLQYNFFGEPARFFYMRASKMMIPVDALHVYKNKKATFVVRAASLFNVVDQSGAQLSETETVTLLNDWCIFAPGNLIDERLKWEEISAREVKVIFTNGPYTVSAFMTFNTEGWLTNFYSEDRSELKEDGTLEKKKWSTPVRNYIDINGMKLPGYGEAVYHYGDSTFAYGRFTLKNIEYNLRTFKD